MRRLLLRKSIKDKKGSMTVEMAFIFPMVLVFIIFICYIAAMLYNRTVALALTNKNLDKASVYWLKSNVDFETGDYISNKKSIYSSIYDFEANSKKAVLEQAIKNDISKYMLAKNISIKSETETKNYVIYRKLKNKVTIDYGVPFKGLFRIIGINKPIKDTVYSESVINNPVEFTRNVDFTFDVYNEVIYKTDSKDYIGDFGKKMNDLLTKFEEFLK